ncbi:fec operon regulator FecR [compost metagenome]
MNSGSAVDVRYGAAERRLVLMAGEVLVTTGQEKPSTYRPFMVQTPQGEVQALGTRFSVRLIDDRTEVMVFEHAVLAQPAHTPPLRIDAGQRASFTAGQAGALAPVDDGAALWEQGMLVVRDQRLADVVAELARHRPGFLRCSPEVADLRVSGALSLRDTDAALRALAERLPIAVQRVTRYWVSVGPAGA